MNLVTERTVMRLQFMETHTCTSADSIFGVKMPLCSKNCIEFCKGSCYLRAKMSPEKFSKLRMPMQNCSIGFRC
ncbi:hypothetical protein DPMN_090071 [Dreissena polymorpha]|uniref:Uncharacterized protein n=1 Tax=Dreissena polymorpha TaxID=45954 RepID=A0A9D4QZG8_DREPO|nr:hypothetical protein DPMN_090071 [Dreissena polymorpha]